jgi:hypothetical protein
MDCAWGSVTDQGHRSSTAPPRSSPSSRRARTVREGHRGLALVQQLGLPVPDLRTLECCPFRTMSVWSTARREAAGVLATKIAHRPCASRLRLTSCPWRGKAGLKFGNFAMPPNRQPELYAAAIIPYAAAAVALVLTSQKRITPHQHFSMDMGPNARHPCRPPHPQAATLSNSSCTANSPMRRPFKQSSRMVTRRTTRMQYV